MKPEADWSVETGLVDRLLRDQCPGRVGPLVPMGSGWDNQMFRLGTDWAVRLPRRRSAVALVEKEWRWLPDLGPSLPLPVPVPVFRGEPSGDFPWPWIVQPWLPGRTADLEAPHPGQASVLAAFWKALHQPAPLDAPDNPFRGVPLSERDEVHRARVGHLESCGVALDPLLHLTWDQAVEAPLDRPRTWIHADLHPRNLLVRNGALAGVLDWGDLTVGDPAVDLAAAWMLLEGPEAQRQALQAYGGVSGATLRRSLGWAVAFGVMFLDAGTGGEEASALLGRAILDRVKGFVTP